MSGTHRHTNHIGKKNTNIVDVKLRIAVSAHRWSTAAAHPRTSSPEAGVRLKAHTRRGTNGRAVVWNVEFDIRAGERLSSAWEGTLGCLMSGADCFLFNYTVVIPV